MTPQAKLTALRADLMSLQTELVEQLSSDRSRQRSQNVRVLHEVRAMLDQNNPFASQAGQDRVVDKLFKGKREGTFVDVGGYDGLTGSNTLFFERHKDWTGILVEPVGDQRAKAEMHRNCPCLPFAVADTDGEADFIEVTQGFTQMSGLASQYDDKMLARVRADQRHQESAVRVETRTLSRLLSENGIMHPDFVSLDIEGGEPMVLRAFPFQDHRVGVWAIENNTETSEISEIMGANGYVLVEFCGPDEVYALPELV